MVSGQRVSTYGENLEELNMSSLEERLHQGDMVQIYKIIEGHDSVNKGQWFRLASENTVHTQLTTGPLNLLKLQCKCNMDMRANFFSLRVIDSWNLIPDNIKTAWNVW
jgi:hypothetical protein